MLRSQIKKKKTGDRDSYPPINISPTDKMQKSFCKDFFSGLPPWALGRLPAKANESRGDGAFVPARDKSLSGHGEMLGRNVGLRGE
jgi:hypothetical protein